MSIILRPNLSPEDALQITTLSAVAVAESIEEFTLEPAQIKWVNDIYFKNKKVCGILAESSLNSKTGALDYIVLGIGINLFQPSGGFPKDIENIAGAIFDKPFKDARSSFIGSVLTRFYAYYNKIEEKTFLTEYKKRSLLTGKSVTVNTFTSSYPATVLSINDDFSLRLLLPDGTEKTLSTGEVSVKLK